MDFLLAILLSQTHLRRHPGFDRAYARLRESSILALPVGAAMGAIISISNVVAVCSILGLVNQGGFIIKRASIAVAIYGAVAGLSGLIIT